MNFAKYIRVIGAILIRFWYKLIKRLLIFVNHLIYVSMQRGF